MNYQNFISAAAALVFMRDNRGALHDLRFVHVVNSRQWKARVYWADTVPRHFDMCED